MDSENLPLAEQPVVQKTATKTNSFKKFTRRFFIVLALGLIFSVYWFFYNSFSNGERTGILIKITHKGNLFKTDEGEMWLSCRQMSNPEKFYFSVTSDSIYSLLKNLQDECVQLTYTQYRGAIPWRGDTKYIVTGVAPIKRN